MSLDWTFADFDISHLASAIQEPLDGDRSPKTSTFAKFFIGVLSTGIYCRSICRARTAKESNVRYFPSAAAAAEAGFRPCLRCRPECSPGTPGWLGTPSTVARALRLIDGSSLEESGGQDGGVESLAERLGIVLRHVRPSAEAGGRR